MSDHWKHFQISADLCHKMLDAKPENDDSFRYHMSVWFWHQRLYHECEMLHWNEDENDDVVKAYKLAFLEKHIKYGQQLMTEDSPANTQDIQANILATVELLQTDERNLKNPMSKEESDRILREVFGETPEGVQNIMDNIVKQHEKK